MRGNFNRALIFPKIEYNRDRIPYLHFTMIRFLAIGFSVAVYPLIAQSSSTLLGARAAGMGYASATNQNEWSIFNNIAGLATLKERTAAISYDLRPALPGANRMGALIALPFSFGVTGLGIFRFGNNIYSEQLISLSFANKIEKTSLGGSFNYIQYKAEGFGTHSAIGLNLGGITQLTPTLAIGAWIQNLNQPRINFTNKEKAPVKLLAAVSFKPIETFCVVTEIEKDLIYKAIWKTGMEYIIHKKFFARAGFNVNPNALFVGLGMHSWRIKIDYALQSFTQLGASHQASASYRLSDFAAREK